MYPENYINPTNQYIPDQQEYYCTRTSYAPPSQTNSIYVNKKMMNATSTKVLVNPNFRRQVHVNPNFNNGKNSTVFVNPNVFNKVQPIRSHTQQASLALDLNNHSKSEGNTSSTKAISYQYSQVNVIPTVTQPIVSKYSKINNNRNTMLSNKVNHKTSYCINNKLITNLSASSMTISTPVLNKTIEQLKGQSASKTVINTKNKLVRIPQKTTMSGALNSYTAITSNKPIPSSTTKTALVHKKVYSPRTPKQLISRHKLVRVNNTTNLRTIVKSKYKLIRCGTNVLSPLRVQLKQRLSLTSRSNTRFKLDNRTRRQSCTIIRSQYKLTKKAYMMRLDPQNTIIKNTKFKLIRSCRLRRHSIAQKVSEKKTILFKSPKKDSKVLKTKNYTKRNLVKINKRRLQKNNMPCEMYNKKGKCKGLASGKCSKKHDPNQIQICIWFLQGICRDDKCTLSHKVSPEKMPTCKFFLEGMCHKDNCPYLHVKLSKDAPVCVDFLNGYCTKGLQCDKRHQFLCPDFERDGNCRKKLCRYPHGKAVRQYKDKLLRVIARNRKSKANQKRIPCKKTNNKLSESSCVKREKIVVADVTEIDNKRYYECSDNVKLLKEEEEIKSEVSSNDDADHNDDLVSSIFDRPKLGSLPSFISL